MMGTAVKECTEDGVYVGEERQFIRTRTVIWSGGIRGNHLLEESGFQVSRGRVAVDAQLRCPQFEDVFIIGDCSIVMNPEGKTYPPSAQISTQQGEIVARNLIRIVRGQTPKDFKYVHRGTIASIGKGVGIGTVGSRNLTGKSASMMKKVVDNRYLLKIGGVQLVAKKGHFL